MRVKTRELRTARKWTIKQTAEETGISFEHVKKMEYGTKQPSIQTLWRIAQAFNCYDLRELVSDE